MSETTAQTFERWLSDGDTFIGVFQNQDLGHYDIGRKIAMPFPKAQWDVAKLDETKAPDHKSIGLGWRYLLVGKFESAQEAVECLEGDE